MPDPSLRHPSAAASAPVRILLLASGGGSNAERIIAHFAARPDVGRVVGLLTNNPTAGALAHAARAGIRTHVFDRAAWRDGSVQSLIEREFRPDLIVLAGFLWLVPAGLVMAYAGRILNIHPSLLPKFGGRGMHGHHVHEAVLAARETESGMTIHLVNEHYDDGATLFQARCPVRPADTPTTLAARVLTLEHRYLPLVAEAVARGEAPEAFVCRAVGHAVPPDEIVVLPSQSTPPLPGL